MNVVEQNMIFNAANERPNRKYACTPSLLSLTDSSILCSFKTGPAKTSKDDNIIIYRSVDGARTWQPLFAGFNTTLNGSFGSIHSCYITECAHRKLLASCCWVDRTHPELPYSNPQTGGILPVKCMITESADGGNSWSCLKPLDLHYHVTGACTAKIVVLQNGNLVLPYENWKQWDQIDGNYVSGIVISEDLGNSWSWPIHIVSDPFARRYFWDCKLAVNSETGRILASFWTADSKTNDNLSIHIVTGSADGTEWSGPVPLGIIGRTATPLFIDGHHVILIYVDPIANSLKAISSFDGGQNWDEQNSITIWKASGKLQRHASIYDSTFGGPDAIKLNDNAVLIAFYAGDSSALNIQSVVLRL